MLTPIYNSRPKSLRDTLSGQFAPAGPHKTAEVLQGAGVSKRAMSDSELKHRKKLQAGIATTTSTLGLSALGMKGAAVARSGGKVGRLLRIKPHAAQAARLDRAALNTGIVSGGIGGLGGYNFASYTRAEGKRRQALGKAADWKGIEEHQRRAADARRHRRQGANVAGAGGGAMLAGVAMNRLQQPVSGQAYDISRAMGRTAKSNWAWRGSQYRGQEGESMARGIARNVRRSNLKGLKAGIKARPAGAVYLAGAGALVGGGGAALAYRSREKSHNRAISRLRRQNYNKRVKKSYGGAMDFGLSGVRQGNAEVMDRVEIHKWTPNIKFPGDPAKMTVKSHVIRDTTPNFNLKQIGAGPSGGGPKPSGPGKAGWSKKKVIVGTTFAGAGAAGGGAAYEVGRRKKKPSNAQIVTAHKMIGKAYDPERNRKRRLGAYQQATMFGAGALGAGAGYHGYKAAGQAREYHRLSGLEKDRWEHKAFQKGGTTTATKIAGKAQHAGKLKAIKTGSMHGGKAAAFGVGAAGAALASNRIGSFRKGRGRSYNPMHTIGY